MPNMYTPCDEVEFKLNRAIEEEAGAARYYLGYLLTGVLQDTCSWDYYSLSIQNYIHACALTDDARRTYNALPGVKHSR